jgi:deoxycytidine triphosphate deaminase
MPRNKRKLTEYDLAVRVVFEHIKEQLDALVDMQKKRSERYLKEEFLSDSKGRVIIPSKSRKLAV